jgi:hypothetical protein
MSLNSLVKNKINLNAILFIACYFLSPFGIYGQTTDTSASKKVTTPLQKTTTYSFPDSIFRFNAKIQSPKRAGFYSALIPGLGQIYNKQYWKAGIVYAGFGAVTGFMISNVKKYQYYQKVYLGRIDSDPSTTDTITIYTTDDINTLRKGYRKYTEYTAIAGTVAYLINILDAYISAHLKTFDMSKDISLQAMPYINERRQPGFKIAFALK